MHKRDFEELAGIIRKAMENNTLLKNQCAERNGAMVLISLIAEGLEQTSSSYNQYKFERACGFNPEDAR